MVFLRLNKYLLNEWAKQQQQLESSYNHSWPSFEKRKTKRGKEKKEGRKEGREGGRKREREREGGREEVRKEEKLRQSWLKKNNELLMCASPGKPRHHLDMTRKDCQLLRSASGLRDSRSVTSRAVIPYTFGFCFGGMSCNKLSLPLHSHPFTPWPIAPNLSGHSETRQNFHKIGEEAVRR